MKPAAVSGAFANFGLHYPVFGTEVLSLSWAEVSPLLITAIPLGIYNFTEAINNVESAAAGGDEFDPGRTEKPGQFGQAGLVRDA